jgi:single-strand DNA-binding protein
MSASVNKVIIVGNLGSDPEVRYTPAGQACCKMSVATSYAYRDKQEEKQERTDWHKVVAWGKTAELCKQYLSKGRSVYVEGHLKHDRVEGKDGTPRYFTEVVSDRVVFLGGGRGGGSYGGGGGTSGGGARSLDESEPSEPAQGPAHAVGPPAEPPGSARRTDDELPF